MIQLVDMIFEWNFSANWYIIILNVIDDYVFSFFHKKIKRKMGSFFFFVYFFLQFQFNFSWNILYRIYFSLIYLTELIVLFNSFYCTIVIKKKKKKNVGLEIHLICYIIGWAFSFIWRVIILFDKIFQILIFSTD